MKKINWKKNVATLMGMVCALSCTVANVDTNATPMVNAASITGTIEDVMNTAINATKEVSAIETNSKYNMTSTSRAVDAVPHYRNVGKRSSQNYNKIIDQFNVAKNPRYRVTNGSTWCNIYAWDVMRAMNVPFSHWIANGKPLTYKEAKKTKGAYECGVTRHLKWLNTYGSKYGWRKVSANEAQKRANKGYPTLVMNTSGTHIAVVRPETSKYKYSTNNPVISQAGAYNVNYGKVKTYFGTTNNLVYWTHE
ncbi:MAG: hypothetical protein E7510_14455 [Ruminococcus sp.]|nr:hypothetical protein [Ruminococcus sp.]